ncbi:MAG: hypothetical protein V3R50_05035, partial [Gammaproteobacteria bacterium]
MAVARPALPDRRATAMNLMGIILVATTLVAGCATAPGTPAAQAMTRDMLLEARPLVGEGVASSLPDTDVLALDPQMLVFLDRYVDA